MLQKKIKQCLVAITCALLLTGCGTEDAEIGKVDTGKVDTGDIDTGKVDTGDVDTGKVDTGDVKVNTPDVVVDVNKGWEITQYGPRDINSSFYTIYNETEGLIVIDGGWAEDAEYVMEVIDSYGGHVDAWILTHPHQDHVGAFNAIYPNPGGITIGEIYTVDMASPEDCLGVAPWDSVDAYNDFLALDISEIKYLYAGDVIELCGLDVEILNAFDDNVRVLSRDYLNDGSMMFKVSGEKESFLFCADVGMAMSDFLLQKHGAEKLASTYLQMGHHGYGGLNDSFYRAVCPTIAFFDAPDWLMLDTTGKYDTPEHVELMQGLGSEIFSFSEGPNTILLE